MHYTLFFPGRMGANPKHLEECGLSDLSRDGSPMWVETVKGPGDQQKGMLAYWPNESAEQIKIMQMPEMFDWEQSAARDDRKRGDYWIGICKQSRPTPKELARSQAYRGIHLTLGDGRDWLIPSAFYLPHDNGLDWENGKYKRKAKSGLFFRYEARAAVYAAQIFSREEEIKALCRVFPDADPSKEIIDIPLEDSWEHSVEALSINYRVNDEIVDLLKILDDTAIINVCCASFDLFLIRDAVKKKELASPIGIPAGQTFSRDELDTK